MKYFVPFCFTLLISLQVHAQVPAAFSYQAIARDNAGHVLPNQEMTVEISIIREEITGPVIYAETHQTMSNASGLIRLEIGRGEAVSGSFSEINWADGPYYLHTGISINKTGHYRNLGTTELLSVPFAMYSAGSGLQNIPALNQAQIDTLSAVAGTVVMNTTTDCINYYTGTQWMEMCGNCAPQPSQAFAGNDQTITGNETQLAAEPPQTGAGLWSVVSGSGGNIIDPSDPVSLFTGQQPEDYTLEWTVSTVCGSTADQVSISFINEPPPPSDNLIFAPYVDCLLWPNFEIQNVAETGICMYTCAFIVDNQAEPGANPCWGGYPTLGTDYYQDKIANLRSQGGDVIVSFGGANGIELAWAAEDEFELRDAYKTVIDAYQLTMIDFDIEGMYVAHTESVNRRSKAMKLLQDEYPGLQISLTLPVMPDGLTQDGLNVVESAISENVTLHRVNVMAMNYGPSGIDMGDAAISAGEALFIQLKDLYTDAGISLPDSVVWKKIGITPMIGENDLPGEIFYQDDAADLAAWAVEKSIGLLSMWSANRDRQCENPNDPLYSCSHVPQELFEFSSIFGNVAMNPCENKKE